MNSKLTLPDLIAALSENANVSRSLSERFIKTLFSIVADTVINGENIKIKGLGTFKVSDVEERKSVNVNTGSEMIIPAHRKISFSPDKTLSEVINAPFSLFEAVELDDEVSEQMLAQADDVSEAHDTTTQHDHNACITGHSEMISESENGTDVLDPATMENSDDDTQSTLECEIDTENEQTSPTTDSVEPIDDTEDNAKALDSTPSSESTTHSSESNASETESQHPIEQSLSAQGNRQNDSLSSHEEIKTDDKKVEIHVHSPECHAPHFRRGIYIGIIVAAAVLLIIMTGWRLLLPESFCFVTNTALPQSQKEIISKAAIPATPAAEANKPDLDADTAIYQKAAIQPIEPGSDESAAPTEASDSQEPPKVYDTITRKRFLTTMAKEHYGNYNLWPFIYDENRDHLGHPDRIKPGTKVIIPPASKYNIDANDPKCVERAKKRGAEIYAKYK